MSRRTSRWSVAFVAAVLTSGVGVLLADPNLVLLSIPAVVFAVYPHLTRPPAATLEIERSIAEQDPAHGQEVEVTVTLRNAGDRTLSDVRVVDGVAPMLSVRSGSARHAAVLGPGTETTFSYTIVAKRGVHRFEPATAVLRDASGGVTLETTLAADTELACRSPIRTLPLGHTARYAGPSATTDSGSGIEFSRIRSYRPGDPPGRIDWNRYARSGELTTVSFREERSRTTVCCLDAREICYRSSGHDSVHAVSYERAAARELLDAASDAGEPVGVAVFGVDVTWLAPATGSHHVATAYRTLEDPETLPIVPPTEWDGTPDDAQARELRARIGPSTTVLLLSPLLDEFPLETARTLRAEGHSVTVLSPDVTTAGSLGRGVARLRRENRVDALRRAGVPVVDWEPETPLETAIRRGERR
ncbi:DUF58 domain-containing protein [Halomontanus rarus]|uniref:DUF58 domain-containing protein n=1 Tax=Halomontanus rarus TaxID=3034020 RepID=UPI0023E8B3A8|nr:DUF58 domain-containing protein [Halovivax sp. TS33]